MSQITLAEQAAPSTPASGYVAIYPKSDGQVYSKDDAGTETALGLSASPITNSLGANVTLNNTANYFSGPTVAQGSTGTWFASGTITFFDSSAAATFYVKLWDGTTVIASCAVTTPGANLLCTVSLSGYLASPAGNIRIDARDVSSTNGTMVYNQSGESKDCTVSAFRVA